MQGLPLTRTTAPDGNWAYTLYNSREYPFIHALPLGQGAWAACIELPKAWRVRVASLRLRAAPAATRSRCWTRDGRVVATADLAQWKLALSARVAPVPWPARSGRRDAAARAMPRGQMPVTSLR